MNIMIPLGGKGQRFKDQDYKVPKVLIPVLGKEVIFWVIESLKVTEEDTVTIVYNNELENYRLEDRLQKKFKCIFHFIKLPFQTNGPVETILYGLNKLPADVLADQLVIHDGDSFIKDEILSYIKPDENKIFYTVNDDPNPIYSYISLDDFGRVTDIAEKRKISDCANIGCYVFDSGTTFIKYGSQLSSEGGEKYVSSVYVKMLEAGEKINATKILAKNFVCLGTPSQVVDFALNNKGDTKTFCFDLDNTLVTYPIITGDYSTVEPIEKNIKFLKQLKAKGHKIIIYTARRMLTHKSNVGRVVADIGQVTMDNLKHFDIPYDEIYFGKPHADFYIDDLMVSSFDNLEKETGFYTDVVEARDFNNIVYAGNTVIKTSTNGSLEGQSYFYQHIPEEIKEYFPKIVSADKDVITMEKIEGNTFSKMYCNKILTPDHLGKLWEVIDDVHCFEGNETPQTSIYSNYSRKLRERYATYNYSKFPRSEKIFLTLLSALTQYEKQECGDMTVIHGDLVFSNIILTNDNKIKLIDMRGKLGDELTIYGDRFYDYAKIYQSVIGYDFILNDVAPSFLYIKQHVDRFELMFKTKFGDHDFNHLKYLTASLLFTLIPLHNNRKCMDYFNLIQYLI